jgi:enolase
MGQLMKKKSILYIRDNLHNWQKIGKLDEESKVLSITEDRLNDGHILIPFSIVKKGWFNAISLTVNIGEDTDVYNIPVEELKKDTDLIISHTQGEDPNFVIPKVQLQKWKV